MTSIDPANFIVGNPEEWRTFAAEYKSFLEVVQKVFDTGDILYGRTFKPKNNADLVVFGLGVLCLEDFHEIYTLAGNGLGFGAAKILRGMFERLVTATYLNKHPEFASRFISFEHIRHYKLALPLWEAYGDEFIAKADFDEMKAEKDRVLPDFMQPCKTSGCSNVFPSASWTDLDFVSMTRAAGEHLMRELPSAYRLPMGETHPSFTAITSRMTKTPEGLTFQDRIAKGKEFVPTILVQAHSAVLNSFNVQLEQFPDIKPAAENAVEECAAQFLKAWEKRPGN